MARIKAYLGVFENKLQKAKDRINAQIKKTKESGGKVDKEWLKAELKAIKGLRKTVRELKEDNGVDVQCPHCKKHFKL